MIRELCQVKVTWEGPQQMLIHQKGLLIDSPLPFTRLEGEAKSDRGRIRGDVKEQCEKLKEDCMWGKGGMRRPGKLSSKAPDAQFCQGQGLGMCRLKGRLGCWIQEKP